MPTMRRTLRQLAESKNARRRAELERAVADGRLVIRSLTARERDESDARWAATAKARVTRHNRRTGTSWTPPADRCSAPTRVSDRSHD